ncbi:hypothetical protein ABKS89_06625 [Pseudomonas sp. LABIM340]|uniref:1,5-rhamnosyltransferase n=1 Tax=Pseudomonas nitroreducens TaxID=46680 RepID=A0A5R9A155_PSENT|nr:hypothetical protein [Pseudomonas nitroreducens]TLP72418.1 hypothetical protein FEA48_19260 [Pseudomonas nitroreducens]
MKIFFLGWKAEYERAMIESLKDSFDVRIVQVPGYVRRIYRLFRSLGKRLPVPMPLEWLGRRVNARHGERPGDILVCNEGELLHGINAGIASTFNGHKVLLVRDLVDRQFIDSVRGLFDRVYSFDPEQCSLLDVERLDQFFPFNEAAARQLASSSNSTGTGRTCTFLGRDKGRSATVLAIAEALRKQGCELDFHIVRDKSTQVASPYHVSAIYPYRDSLRMTLGADVLVEVNQTGQAGYTLRVLETLFFDKKLLTTNARVKQESFYDPGRFFIWGVDSPDDLPRFLEARPAPVSAETLYRYTPAAMVERLVAER